MKENINKQKLSEAKRQLEYARKDHKSGLIPLRLFEGILKAAMLAVEEVVKPKK